VRKSNFVMAIMLGVVIGAGATQAGVVASSTFDTDQDGWLVAELHWPTSGPPYSVLNTQTPNWVAAGGNPGGHLENSINGDSTVYWSAPAKFLGSLSTIYGGTLSFDLFDAPADNPFNQEDIILIGGGKTVVFDMGNIGPQWTHYSVRLTENAWKLDNLAGSPATQADMLTVFGNLNTMYIRGEYQLGADTRGIDNVVLTEAPEPVTFSLLIFGGLAFIRRRKL
jgi:hypothetical protein